MRAVRMVLIAFLVVGAVWAGLRFCLARVQISEREALSAMFESWELGEAKVPLGALGVPNHVRRDNRALYDNRHTPRHATLCTVVSPAG